MVGHLLVEKIILRIGCPLEILTDKGTENINKTMKETLKEMNIYHVKTSYFLPSINGKTERFHRTSKILSKKITEDYRPGIYISIRYGFM